jgi:hypothetical protein
MAENSSREYAYRAAMGIGENVVARVLNQASEIGKRSLVPYAYDTVSAPRNGMR